MDSSQWLVFARNSVRLSVRACIESWLVCLKTLEHMTTLVLRLTNKFKLIHYTRV